MPSAIAPLETSTTSRPSMPQRGDLLRPARERRAVEALPVVGDEAAADLDDEALALSNTESCDARCGIQASGSASSRALSPRLVDR